MVLPDAPPEEALAAIAAGSPIMLPCCTVPADGTQGTHPEAARSVEVGCFRWRRVCLGRDKGRRQWDGQPTFPNSVSSERLDFWRNQAAAPRLCGRGQSEMCEERGCSECLKSLALWVCKSSPCARVRQLLSKA